jgi:Zn-dependent protease with chaperone function
MNRINKLILDYSMSMTLIVFIISIVIGFYYMFMSLFVPQYIILSVNGIPIIYVILILVKSNWIQKGYYD